MRVLVVVLTALSLAVRLGGVSLAADPPLVPDASECQTVPQRSLVVLFASPAAGTPRSEVPGPGIALSGVPADADTTAAVTTTTRAVIACFNRGDFWSLLTLVSDDYLRRAFVDGVPSDPLSLELEPFINAVRGCTQCTIAPRTGEDRLAIASLTNVRLLADGRVGADLTLSTPAGANAFSMVVAFAPVGDRWVADEIVSRDSPGTPVGT